MLTRARTSVRATEQLRSLGTLGRNGCAAAGAFAPVRELSCKHIRVLTARGLKIRELIDRTIDRL